MCFVVYCVLCFVDDVGVVEIGEGFCCDCVDVVCLCEVCGDEFVRVDFFVLGDGGDEGYGGECVYSFLIDGCVLFCEGVEGGECGVVVVDCVLLVV